MIEDVAMETFAQGAATLARLVDANIIGIATCDADGRILDANDAYLEMLGYSQDELASGIIRWRELTPPEWQETSARAVAEIQATGRCALFEKEYFRKDGNRVPVLMASAAIDEAQTRIVGFVLDLSARNQSRQALRRSEAYLAEAQRLSHTGSFGWNVATDEHFWSEETYRIFEFDTASQISMPMILERVHPQDVPLAESAVSAASRGEGIDLELRLVMPDGRIKHLHVVGKVETNEASGVEIIGAAMDITARKLTEIQLRRSKAHLADAQRLSRVGTVGVEVSTKRIFWSDEAARIYGYPPGTEATPELILQRSHPDDVALFKDVLERAAQGGSDFDWEHRLLMPDGSIKYLHDLAHHVTDEAGNDEIVGAIMDVTERKQAEDERARLAGEIHDTLAQALAMIVMQLANAEAKLGTAWSHADKSLSMVRELAVESLAYARRSVNVLRPNVATGGLSRAIRDIVDSVRRHFTGSLILDVTGDAVLLDAAVESAFVGIAREALANAIKHSNATRISVDLNFARGATRLVVSDDGVGFDPNAVRADGYGLVSMQERAARASVALTFVTEPGAGTTIVAGWSSEVAKP